MQAVHSDAPLEPQIEAPSDYATPWERDAAIVDLLRARLTGLGPTTVAALAASLALQKADIEAALLALEAEGYVMRGRFTGTGVDEEWCERHLLARIHRYTVRRLRREIEPVEPRDFMRFLLQWQHVGGEQAVGGPDALAAVLSQLEGFEAPAAAWEADLLPARVAGYEIGWLDDLCQAGRIVWSRLRPPASDSEQPAAGPVRATPIVLLPRRQLALWNGLLAASGRSTPVLSSRAQKVADTLAEHGAMFFDELVDAAHLLATELEVALAELVAVGLVNADSFTGLRALLLPASRRSGDGRAARGGRRPRQRLSPFGIENAGRWSLTRRPAPETTPARGRPGTPRYPAEALEHVVRSLLRRYGVIGWRLLDREPGWLPPWRELVRVCHRLEARGEIRGGRFIAGLSGEQFALPEAIGLLRKVRQQPPTGALVAVAATDPLNLVGSVLAGARVPALLGARVLYRDGSPVASLVAGQFSLLAELDEAEQWRAREHLYRDIRHPPAPLPGPLSTLPRADA